MSTTLQEATPSLLSERSAAVVAATAGVVAAHAEQITARFYPRMFAEHPELLRVFNQGNQATGEQDGGQPRSARSIDAEQQDA